jgi:methionyl aminopeptidase
MIVRKSPAAIETMAEAGRIVVETLAAIADAIAAGTTTGELDEVAEDCIRSRGGVPTFKGYLGFPGSICASPNSMVVHGIPGSYRLEDGDVLSIDVGVTYEGYVGDSAYTFAVGEIEPEAQSLLDACRAALAAGIEQARAGNRVGDVSAAVQRTTEAAGFSVVRSLVGHGVGRAMHEEPQVPNFGEPGRGPELVTGMTLAIEPMITAGSPDVAVAEDRWSISTQDGSLAAHFEHTVAIEEDGPRILTAAPSDLPLALPEPPPVRAADARVSASMARSRLRRASAWPRPIFP